MSEPLRFGIDIGGTSIKIGLVTPAGEIMRQCSLAPSSREDPEILFAEIASSMRDLLNGFADPVGIGICAPGYADRETGVLIDGSSNVPALRKASITEYLRSRFSLPTSLGNDGICAALGELRFGIGREIDSFAFVTLGTGVGGALVWNRQILQGAMSEPPEFGAVVVRPGDGPSRHGITGSVEDLAGSRAMLRRYGDVTGKDTSLLGAKDLFELRRSGDAHAAAVIDDMLEVVAQMIGTIVNLTGLQTCVLGGGISSAGLELVAELQARLAKNTWPLLNKRCDLQLARCGVGAGMIGAAQLKQETLADDPHQRSRKTLDRRKIPGP